MKMLPAIAAEPHTHKSAILSARKIVCVILDSDDLDKLQDRAAMTVNLDEHFSDLPKCSVVFCYHNSESEAIQAFKGAFDLVYLDGKKV